MMLVGWVRKLLWPVLRHYLAYDYRDWGNHEKQQNGMFCTWIPAGWIPYVNHTCFFCINLIYPEICLSLVTNITPILFFQMLSFVFPCHFLHEDVLRHLTSFLNMEDETVAPLVLSVLTFLGKYKPIGKYNVYSSSAGNFFTGFWKTKEDTVF